MWENFRRPQPGDPAPSPGAIDLAPIAARHEKMEWEHNHTAWMSANGLAWTREDLDNWYSHPDRDRLPKPGVLQWQQRISDQYAPRPAIPGEYPGYRSVGPVLDAAADQEVQRLRQARQADAEHIRQLKDQLSRAAAQIADNAAQRAELVDHIQRQDDAMRDQAAWIQEQSDAIQQDKSEYRELERVVEQKDAAIRSLESDVVKLNATIKQQAADAERLQDAVTRHEATNRQLTASIRGKETRIRELEAAAAQPPPVDDGILRALQSHEEVAAWHAEVIGDLNDAVQDLRGQVVRLRSREAIESR